MYIPSKEVMSWKRKMQRELKAKQYALSYKQYEDNFKVFMNPSREGKSIYFQYKFSVELPFLKIEVPSSRTEIKISSHRKNIISHVIKEFVAIMKNYNQTVYQIIISLDTWKWGEEDKSTVLEIMNEVDLLPVDEDKTGSFITKDHLVLLQTLKSVNEVVSKKYYDEYWDKDNPLLHFGTHSNLPTSIDYSFSDSVDRKVVLKADYAKKKYLMTFSSKYHKKEVVLDDLSKSIFIDEYEQFVNEDKYKELFTEPKMNQTIERNLNRAVSNLYPKVKENELFKWLTNHYTVEEMTECTKKQNTYDIKIVSTIKYDDSLEISDEKRERKLYYLYIVKMWGKYISYVHEDIRKLKKADCFENKYFNLYEDLEVAKKEQKAWLIERIS